MRVLSLKKAHELDTGTGPSHIVDLKLVHSILHKLMRLIGNLNLRDG